jgi:7-keto-8-aminopelargonate synthetase-like enzyme
MRRALPALFALALALALAVPATAATPSPARMAAQIRTLQKQVKTLQKSLKKTNTTLVQTEAVAVVALLYGGCSSAATADALQASNPAFGTTPVGDFNACSDLQSIVRATPTIARQPNTPTVNVFQELLNIFK